MSQIYSKEFFNQIKGQMLISEYGLSNLATKSSHAIRFTKDDEDIRLEYERDIDRIIHSTAYTRYIDKTQVYSNSLNDHISKRMTHVQFVSRASKTIARALGLNEDLCEAIALGHDVGHVPFGHVGERILNEISLKYLNKNFAHNLNSVRIFMNIENKGKGLNLTLQTLDGIMCHNGELLQNKYRPVKKNKEYFLKEYNECINDSKLIKKLVPMTLEGCVVRISDIIGYIGKDIDDAKRLGILKEEDIPFTIKEILGTNNKEIMNKIILDIIENSFNKPYINMSKDVYKCLVNLKKFNYENIYTKAVPPEMLAEFKDIFNSLFKYYVAALENEDYDNDIYTVYLKGMSQEYLDNTSNYQKVIDHLSCMTDRYITTKYNKIKS